MLETAPELTLAIALAIGLLVGLERGWRGRHAPEGARVAGVRTFGLIGLLGGLSALLAGELHAAALAVGFAATAAALIAGYLFAARRTGDVSITGLVAGLVTFVLGAAAVEGYPAEAGAAAVVMTLLLGYKPELHRWLAGIEAHELHAALHLLLISVVVLPILPDRGFGPWQALNPYEIWWMVVLIGAISFAGYVAVRLAGPRRGTIVTGLLGGLASSTALTLHFARTARRNGGDPTILAAGILLACGMMFARVALVVGLIDRGILAALAAPLAAMAAIVLAAALALWRIGSRRAEAAGLDLKNPLELGSAVAFGALLAIVMLAARGAGAGLGGAGIVALAALSGVADVDAITLTLARLGGVEIAQGVAVFGIVLAAAVNGVVKGGLSLVVGGRPLGVRAGVPLVVSAFAGLAVAWFVAGGSLLDADM
jgi:uncharacterized membrane protein (DUF4010 family)